MDNLDREIILAFAEHSMGITATAKELYMHINTVVYHLEKIRKNTGLNPRRFYDLVKLVEMAKGDGQNDGTV